MSLEAGGGTPTTPPPTQPIQSPEEVFNSTVAGHFPLSTGISSARYWTPSKITKKEAGQGCNESEQNNGPNVPRPNVNLNWLRFFSLIGGPLGLDHFYANSPTTGVAKLLTLGGFGIWWIWDNLQLWLESDRVLNYGMMPLFDTRFHEPVAQGMITDKPHPYKSTKFSLWAILEIVLGFFGFSQVFYGKVELMFVKLIFAAGVIVYYYYLTDFSNWDIGFKAFYALLGVFLSVIGFAHIMYWIGNASRIVMDPEKLFKVGAPDSGLPIDPNVDAFINPYAKDQRAKMKPNALFEPFNAEQLRKLFMIRNPSEIDDGICNEKDVQSAIGSIIYRFLASTVLFPFEMLKTGIWETFTAIIGVFTNPTKKSVVSSTYEAAGGGSEPLSTESLVLGGTLIALVLGGMIKGSVNHFVPS